MDILAALDQLDHKQRRTNGGTNTKFVDPLKSPNHRRPRSVGTTSRPSTRNQSRPPTSNSNTTSIKQVKPYDEPARISPTPTHLSVAHSDRSPSVTSGRRISFAEPPPPPSTRRRLRLPTKSTSFLSGFEYDPTLGTKYHVGEEEWNHFSDSIIKEARIPKRARYAWFLHKKDIIKRLKRDLQYNGDVQTCITAWNRMVFRKKGFEASLELPGPPHFKQDMTEEEMAIAKTQAPFFRLVVTPTKEKGQSIYVQSRSNSMTASISGEGKIENFAQDSKQKMDEQADEEEDEKIEDIEKDEKIEDIEKDEKVENTKKDENIDDDEKEKREVEKNAEYKSEKTINGARSRTTTIT